tara:strand:+ start:649 stop:1017 length:369 start_codon:yes stop_codon:yes gene_type:complete
MNKVILCFDLDNTISTTKKNLYKSSKPKKKVIKIINSLHNEGYYIKIFTSRFMGRSNENILKAKKKGYNLTKQQLKKWGLSYDKLIFGKPSYDLFVDDKSLGFKKDWPKTFRKFLKYDFKKN